MTLPGRRSKLPRQPGSAPRRKAVGMRNLVAKVGPAKVEESLADLSVELEIEDEPRLAPFLPSVEEKRAAVEEASKAHRKATAKVRVAGRRVVRGDKAVNKAASAVAKALDAHKDEPGVDAVIKRAFPVSATGGTSGLADEKQARFVRNVIEQVRAAPGMPAKVLQRVDELEAAQAKLDAGVRLRDEVRYAQSQSKALQDEAVAAACAFYNELYFDVAKVVGKARAEAIFGR